MRTRRARRFRRRAVLAGLLLVSATGGVAPAETRLVLRDGQVLIGTSLRRESGNYVLTLEGGQTVSLPVELIEKVELEGQAPPPTGLTRSEPQQLGGQPAALPEPSEPQQLAGEPVRPPTRSQQLAVLGEPARFRRDVVDPTWVPTSDWDMSPEQNNFNPAKWSKGVIDPTWTPKSGWREEQDVLADSRSTFRKSIIDSTWTPTDGFNKRGW